MKLAHGQYIRIDQGLDAFVPGHLPRTVELAPDIVNLLDHASQRAGILGGIGEALPDPYLLIRPFISREAVLSSKIEGTETLMADLFLYAASNARSDRRGDASEVANYILAMEHGLDALSSLPMSVRLFNGVHGVLLRDTRGHDKRPGELRRIQVYVGDKGAPPSQASFIPPPPETLRGLLTDLERFCNERLEMPLLVQCALMHHQFETIHPYLDGNGRLGRLLITLFLFDRDLMRYPLLYLSAYLEREHDRYYYELNQVRVSGDWSSWLRFFLIGVAEQANDAIRRARNVLGLHKQYRTLLQEKRASRNTVALLDLLFANPLVTAGFVSRSLGISDKGARGNLTWLLDAGILEVMQGEWPTVYLARELLAAIEEDLPPEKPESRRRLGPRRG